MFSSIHIFVATDAILKSLVYGRTVNIEQPARAETAENFKVGSLQGGGGGGAASSARR